MEQIIVTGISIQDLIELIRVAVQDEQMVTPLNSEGTPKTEFMTIDEFCHEYRIPKQTVYSKASKRKIPHHKFGKRLMFSRKAINEWLKQSERVVK